MAGGDEMEGGGDGGKALWKRGSVVVCATVIAVRHWELTNRC